jgi:peroxiredoxin
MKRITLLSLLLLPFIGFAQKSFFYTLNASQKTNEKTIKLFIDYEIAGIKFKDSLSLNDKKKSITKTLRQPVAATIYTKNNKIQPLSVFLANNTLNLEVTEKSISILKSKLQDDFLFLTVNDRIRPSYFPLYDKLSSTKDTIGLKKLGVIFDSLKNDDIQKSIKYFKANKASLLSLFSFNRYTTFYADYSKVENEFNQLPEWAKSSPDGQSILAIINGAKSTQVGTMAKYFSQKSSKGKNVSLKSFDGKYILLDFWASWCGPCRKEHPNLIKIYEEFKDNNFDIISISLDSEIGNWQKAIIKDQLTWTQLSDLKGSQNDIALQYGVQSVPANFLINPKGIIIGKNLSTEQLNEKLKEILEK